MQVVLSYCHCCLSDTTLLPLLPYLTSKGVGVVSASPLSMGMWRPQVRAARSRGWGVGRRGGGGRLHPLILPICQAG